MREPGLAGLLDEDRDRRLAADLGRGRSIAGLDEQDLEPVDVALRDPVRRVEGERLLIVLARAGEVAQLPEGLGEAVLRLRVRTVFEKLPVHVRGGCPLGVCRLGDRLLGQRPLDPGEAGGALRRLLELGKRHGGLDPFGAARGAPKRVAIQVRLTFVAPAAAGVKRGHRVRLHGRGGGSSAAFTRRRISALPIGIAWSPLRAASEPDTRCAPRSRHPNLISGADIRAACLRRLRPARPRQGGGSSPAPSLSFGRGGSRRSRSPRGRGGGASPTPSAHRRGRVAARPGRRSRGTPRG